MSTSMPIKTGGPTQLPNRNNNPLKTEATRSQESTADPSMTTSMPIKSGGPTQLPNRNSTPLKTETTLSQESTTEPSSTTESSFFGISSGILERVRDLAIALVAGLIAQSVGFPFSPSSPIRKDDKEGEFINVPPRPPLNAKDPFNPLRKQVKGGEGAFDGSTFSLTIPVKPNEVNDLKKDEVRGNIATVVKEAFGSIDPVEDIQVIFAEPSEEDGKIIINAPYAGPTEQVTKPRIATTTTTPQIDNRPKEPR